MVLGTGSHVGKSLVAAGLGRIFSDAGLRVAPFKAQNMSNNARVVPCRPSMGPGPFRPEGQKMGEIGSAQYFQALAARCRPDARMNPVLLKPERDTASQVVVLLSKAKFPLEKASADSASGRLPRSVCSTPRRTCARPSGPWGCC